MVLGCFALCYLLACATPALVMRHSNGRIENWPGIQVLAFGWMGLLLGQAAWLANPVLLLGVILLVCRRWIAACITVLVALGLGATTVWLFSCEIPADEGGVSHFQLAQLGFGFYAWLASMVVVAAGAVALLIGERKRNSASAPT